MNNRTVSVELRANIADYVAKMNTAGKSSRELEAAGRDLRKALIEEEDAAGRARVSETKLAEARKNSKTTVSQLAAAEEDHAANLRKVETAMARTTEATTQYAAAQKKAAADAESSNSRVEDSFSRVSARANAAFDVKSFAGLSLGLPAAAAVGAAGVAAAFTGIATGFAALGVYAAAQDDKIAAAFGDLKSSVVADAQGMGGSLRDDVAAAIDDAGAAWERLKPQVQAAVQASAPAIRTLTGAVTDLAEGAMPGLLVAVQRSGPALEGVRTFAGQAGVGLGEFFTNASAGSAAAGAGFASLGGTVRLLESRLGTLFANLAMGSSGPLNSLYAIVDKVTGSMNALTAQGSGAIGFLNGFTGAGTGAIGVLSVIANAMAALPPQVTQFGGSLVASSMIMSKFGIDAGAAFDGLGGKVKTLGTALATGQGTAKAFGGVMTGLAAGAFSPASIATAGLGILLGELGRRQQEAAQKAQEHKAAVQSLTDALQQDGGVLGEVSQQTIAKSLADKNAATNATALGVTMGTVQQAAEGNTSAMGSVYGATQKMIDGWVAQGKLGRENLPMLQGLVGQLEQYGGAAVDGAYDTGTLTKAEQDRLTASLNLVGAIGSNVQQSREAHQAYINEQQGLTGLTGSMIEARDAAIGQYNAVVQLNNAQLGYRGAVLNTKAAQDAYNQAQRDGKAATDDGQKSLLSLEQAQQAQIQAAYAAAVQTSNSTNEALRNADGMRAANREAVSLANAFSGPLPASLQQSIAKMSASEAEAAGLKQGYNNLGVAVYQLPNGKQIVITSNSGSVIDQIKAVQREVDGLTGKTIRITTVYDSGSSSTTQVGGHGSAGRGQSMNAEGNLYAGRGTTSWGALTPGVGFATGGFPVATATNRLQDLAQVVPPGTLKWVGDARDDEMFAPLNGSRRTAGLLTAAALHEGLINPVQRQILNGTASVQPGVVNHHTTSSSRAVTNNDNRVTIHTQQVDPQRVAAMVSSELAWQMR